MDRIEEAKAKSIVSYLKGKGITPVHESGGTLVYYSPFRDETKPSFIVSRHNRWKDFGTDMKSSDILDLVQQLEGCKLQKAISVLLGEAEGKPVTQHNYKKVKKDAEFIQIKAVEDISHPDLISYIDSRAISLPTACNWLKQLTVTFPYSKVNPTKRHLVLGFKNDSGGYEMRNSYLKVCNAPKNIRTIHGISKGVVFFEGFFDFLSHLEITEQQTEMCTVVVLNSATLLPGVLPYFKGKPGIGLLDNDETGDKYTKMLAENLIPFKDYRVNYKGYNDLNEYLTYLKTL